MLESEQLQDMLFLGFENPSTDERESFEPVSIAYTCD